MTAQKIPIEKLCRLVVSGGTPNRKHPEYFGGGIPWVKTMDLDDTSIRSTNETLTDVGLSRSSAKLLPENTTLIAMYGATVGKMGYLKSPAACNQAACALIPDPEKADPRWLFYCLLNARERLVGLASGAAQQNLNLFTVKEFLLPHLGLTEQRAVAEVLGTLDDKITVNTQAISTGRELLHTRWKKLSRDAATVADLRDIADINPKISTIKGSTALYLDMKNLPEHGLLVTEWGEREPKGGARFQNGDTLIARITPCFENGKAAWVDFLEEDEICYGSTEYIVLRAKEGIPPIAPYLIGTSDRFREFASQRRTGTSGRQRVQAKELADYSVPLPDPERLKEFEEFSDALLRRLGAARNESRALAATRDELLPLLMSGKITVRDAEKRVEKEV